MRDLLRLVDFYGLRTFPAIGLLQLILNHTIHHRGQLSTYLRPMGAKVPSIYGPIVRRGRLHGRAGSNHQLTARLLRAHGPSQLRRRRATVGARFFHS